MAADFFVATNGLPTGDGSPGNPLDLATALGVSSPAGAGDNVLLRGGVYTGSFDSHISGATNNPVTVRSAPGEWAVIDGVSSSNTTMNLFGAWSIYRDFEVMNSKTNRTLGEFRPGGLYVFGPEMKLINLISHDNGLGIGFWDEGTNSEVYGCLIFNIGWQKTNGGTGHSIYTQNAEGTKRIYDTIVGNSFGFGINVYTEGGDIRGYDIQGNFLFHAGRWSSSVVKEPNLFVGGFTPAAGISIVSNYLFHPLGQYASCALLTWPDQTNNQDLAVRDNCFVGGNRVFTAQFWSQVIFSNNTLYGTIEDLVLGGPFNRMTNSYWDRNTYFGGDSAAFVNHTNAQSFAAWKLDTGADANSTQTASAPTGVKVVLRPNSYQAKRAHLAIYNWDQLDNVNVDVSGVLQPGDYFELRNAQNYFLGPVLSGFYTGGTLSVPMTNLTAAVPTGLNDPAPLTDRKFNAFVLTGQTCATNGVVNLTALTSQSVCPGANVSFATTATGTGPFTYVWRKNGVLLGGRTAPTLQLNNVTPADSGTYSIEVYGACAAATNNATLAVASNAPTALASLTAPYGSSLTLTGAASGNGPFAYAWRYNGVLLPGETNATLTIAEVTLTNRGAYSVEGFGACNAFSNTVTLTGVDTNDAALLAYWRLDEPFGGSALDSIGTNHGTLVNGPTRSSGQFFRAVNFDGVDDHVNVPDSPEVDVPPDFTFSLWFKPSVTLDGTAGRKDVAVKFLSYWFLLNFPSADGRLAFVLNGGAPFALSQTTVWNANQWYHIVGARGNAIIKLYVNGVLEGSASSGTDPANTAHPLQIGGDTVQNFWFPGAIDDVRLYRTELSSNAVRHLYAGSLPTNSPPPLVTNEWPTITAIASQTVPEDTATPALAFTIGDPNGEVADLTLSLASSNPALVPTGNLVLGGAFSNRTITVTPATNLSGASTITITVTDTNGDSRASSFLVTVQPVNDPPSILGLTNVTVMTNHATGVLPFTIGDVESAATALAVSALSSDPALVPVANIVLDGVGSNRTVQVTPAAGQSGSAVITLRVSDPDLGTNSGSFTVTVLPYDPVEQFLISYWRFDEAIGAMASDSVGTNNGTLVNGAVRAPGFYSGAVQFDGVNDHVNVPDSVSLDVPPAFSISLWFKPTLALDASSGRQDLAQKFLSYWFLLNFPAADGRMAFVLNGGAPVVNSTTAVWASNQWHHLAGTFGNGQMKLYVNGVLEGSIFTGASPSATANPLQIGGNSTQNIWYRGLIDDVRLYSIALPSNAVLNIFNGSMPTNQPPAPVTNYWPTITTIANQTLNEDAATPALAFTIGDFDGPVEALTLSVTSSNPALAPTNGIVLGGALSNRTVTVTPLANQSGAATITLTVRDALGDSNTTSFLLTVNPVNDLPSITELTNVVILTNLSTPDLAFTIGDVETAVGLLGVSATSSDPALVPVANVVFSGSGSNRTVRVTPAASQSGTALITVLVVDTDGGTNTESFTVTVLPYDPAEQYLVSYWRLDDVLGTGAADSLQRNNGTRVNGATAATGLFGGAMRFDGINDHVNVPDSDTLDLTGTFSFSLWFKPNLTLDGTTGLRALAQKSLSYWFIHNFGSADGRLAFVLDGGSPVVRSTTAAWSSNQWHHVAGTLGDGFMRLYVNGVLEASLPTAATPDVNTVPFQIGGNTQQNQWFPGLIDDVRLYSVALPSNSVFNIFNGSMPTNQPPPPVTNYWPTITTLANQTIAEDTATAALAFTIGDFDGPVEALTLTVVSSNPALTPTNGIVLGGSGSNRTVTVTPAANQSGAALITLTVLDAPGDSNSTSFVLTVTPVNDLPSITALTNAALMTNQSSEFLPFTIGDAETPVGSLGLSATSSNTVLVPPGNIVLGGSGSNHTVRVTPAANQSGSTLITVQVVDLDGGTNSRSFTVTVTPFDPVEQFLVSYWRLDDVLGTAVADSFQRNNGTRVNGPVAAAGLFGGAMRFDGINDHVNVPDSDTLDLGAEFTFSLWFKPSQTLDSTTGRKDIAQKSLSYWFIHNFGAADGRLAFVLDGGSPLIRSTTTVWSSNQWYHVVGTLGGGLMRIYVNGVLEGSLATAATPDVNAVPFQIGGNSQQNQWYAGLVDDVRLYSVALPSNAVLNVFNGSMPTNQPPPPVTNHWPTITTLANQTLNEDAATPALAFTIGDFDSAAETLVLSRTSSNPALLPTNNIVFGGSGSNRTVTLTPLPNQNGSASVTLTVTDTGGDSATAVFTLTVTPVNDPPTIAGLTNTAVQRNLTTDPFPFTIGDVETPAASLALSLESTNLALVPLENIVLGGSGSNRTLRVTPATNQTGLTLLTVRVADADGGSNSVSFLLDVVSYDPVEAQLISYWRLDELSGSRAYDSIGTNLGTLVNGPVRGTGQFAGALRFDGVNDHVTVPDNDTLDMGAEFSISLWFKPTLDLGSASGRKDIAQKYNSYWLMLNFPSANGRLAFTLNGGAPVVNSVSAAWSSNQWYHVVGTLGGGFMRIYVNGVLENTLATGLGPAANLNPFQIGGNSTGNQWFPGLVDDVRLYRVALTSNSVFNIYSGSSPTNMTTPLTNQFPVISFVADQTLDEDTPSAAIPFTVSDFEDPVGSLVLAAGSSNPALLPTNNIVFGGSGSNRTVTLTPLPNQSGTATVTLTATDSSAESGGRSFVVTVNAVNDPPVISPIANWETLINVPTPDLPFSVGDVETPAASLGLVAASSNPTVAPAGNVVFGGSGSNRTVRVTPVAGQAGSAVITVFVTDGGGGVSSNAFTVNFTSEDPNNAFIQAYWRFDETNGMNAYDSFGTNAGALVNGVLRTAGRFGGAYAYDGVNDYINVPDGPGIDPATNFTFCLWFKPSAVLDNTSGRKDVAVKFLSYWFLLNFPSADGRLAFVLNGGAPFARSTTAVWNPGQWYHVAGTLGGGQARIYVNGVLEGVTATAVAPSNSTHALQFGGDTAQNFWFPGAIDDARLYNVALSSNAIMTLYNGSMPTNQPNAPLTNQWPVMSVIADQTIPEEGATATLDFTVGDGDDSVNALTLSASSSNPSLVSTQGIVLGGSGSNRTVRVTPLTNQFGTATITISATDPLGGTGIRSFLLTVQPVNDLPSITMPPNWDSLTNFTTPPLPFVVGDLETPAGSLTVTADSSNPALVPVGNIVLGGSGSNRTVRITPVAGLAGSSVITVTVTDADSGTASNSFTVTFTEEDVFHAALRAYWRLDETNGLIVYDSITGIPGDLVNGPTFGTGLFQGALNFDGAGARVNATDVPLLDAPTNFSFSLWFNPSQTLDATSGRRDLAVKLSSYWMMLNFPSSDGRLAFVLNGGSPFVRSTTSVWSSNQWHHVVGTLGGGLLRLYVNGVLEATTATTQTPANTTNALQLGGSSATGFYFPGALDDVRLYGAGLPHTAVWNLFNGSTPTNQPPPPRTNEFPILSSLPNQTNNEDVVIGPLAFTTFDPDSPVETLTLDVYTSNPLLLPTNNLVFGGLGTNRTLTLTPALNESGTVTVTLTLTDTNGAIAVTAFDVTVLPVNDAPVMSAIVTQGTPTNQPTPEIPFTVGDAESPPTDITVMATSSNPTVVPSANIFLTGTGSNRTVRVQPAADQFGSATITLIATDPGGAFSTNAFLLNVFSGNTPPTISSIASQFTGEDLQTPPIAFTINDAQTGPANLILNATSSNTNLVPNGNWIFGGSNANRTITVIPATNQNGAVVITLTVSDGVNVAGSAFLLTVNPMNDPPVITSGSFLNVAEGAFLMVTNTAFDPDQPPAQITWSLLDNPGVPVSGNYAFNVGGGLSAWRLSLVGTNPVINVVALGDSITEGLNASDKNTLSWVARVRAALQARFGDAGVGLIPTYRRLGTPTPVWTVLGSWNTLENPEKGPFKSAMHGAGNGTHAQITVFGDNVDLHYVLSPFGVGAGPGGATLVVDSNAPIFLDGFATNYVNATLNVSLGTTGLHTVRINAPTVPGRTIGLWGLSANIGNRGLRVHNVGRNGTRVEDTSGDNPRSFINRFEPSLTIIGLTSNDYATQTDTNAFRTNTIRLITEGLRTGSVLLLASPPRAPEGQPIPHESYHLILRQLAATYNCALIDIKAKWGNVASASASGFSSDGVHPDDLGHQDIANAVLAELLRPEPASLNPFTGVFTWQTRETDGPSTNVFRVVATEANFPNLTATNILTIVLREDNIAPSNSPIADVVTPEDTSTGPIPFVISDEDDPVAFLSVSGFANNATLLPPGSVSFGGSGSNRTVTLNPAANQSGTATVSVVVSDGVAARTNTFQLTVTPVADAPSVSDIADRTVARNLTTGDIPFTVSDPDSPPASLVLTGTSSNPALVPPGNILFGGSGSNRTVRVTPAFNQSGTAIVTVIVSDGVLTNSDSFVLDVKVFLEPATNNLISHWRLDETNGVLAMDSAGPNPGTMLNGGTRGPGQLGRAVFFDGINDVVTMPDSVSLDVTAPFSLSFWFRPNAPLNAASGRRDVLQKFLSYWVMLNFPSSDGRLTFTLNGGAPYVQTTTASWSTNQWRHLACTYDGLHIRIYVDGVLEGAAPATVSVANTASSLQFGGNTTQNYYFGGGIDDVRLYRTAITSNEVTAIFVIGSVGNVQNLPPSIGPVGPQSTPEDTPSAPIAFTVGDPDSPVTALMVTGLSGDPLLVPPANIVTSGTGSNRTVVVTPGPNRSGVASIQLVVMDEGGGTATNSFSLTVTPVDDAPVISDITDKSVAQSIPTGHIPFTVGDAETAASNLIVSAVSDNPAVVPNGNITLGGGGSNRTIRLTPVPGISAAALITVTVADGALTNSDTFTLNVLGPNQPPVVTDLADRTINEDGATGIIPFTVSDVETPAAELTVTVDSSNPALTPPGGLVLGGSGTNRTLSITPPAEMSGMATITLRVSDGITTTEESFVLTVSPVNDLPVISNVADQNIEQDRATELLGFTVGDVETPAASLVVTADSSNPTLVPPSSFTLGGSGSNRTVRVTPATNLHGTAIITLTVSDGTDTAIDTFLLTVRAFSDPSPTNLVSHWKFEEGSGTNAMDSAGTNHGLLVNGPMHGAGLLGGGLRFDGVNDHVNIPDHPSLDLPPNFTFSLWFKPTVPLSGATGRRDLFQKYTAYWLILNYPSSDGRMGFTLNGGSPTARTTTSAWSTNQWYHIACVYSGAQMRIYVNGVLEGSVAASGAVANTATPLQIGGNTTANNFFPGLIDDVRIHKVALSSNDVQMLHSLGAGGGTPPPANIPPTITAIGPQTTLEDMPVGPLAFTVNDAETAAASLTLSGVSSNTVLVPNASIVFGGSGSNRTVTVTPGTNQSGATTIAIIVSDGSGGTVTNRFAFTVVPTNDPPVIGNIADQTTAQSTGTPELEFTVGDPESAAAALTLAATSTNAALAPTNGIVFGGSGSNRTVRVTPVSGLSGTSLITVTVTDEAGASASDSFLLTVTGPNQPPTISDLADRTVDEDMATGLMAFSVGDVETPATSLLVSASSSNPQLVPSTNLVLAGSGANRTLNVFPAAHQSGTAVITVTVSDGVSSTNDTFLLTVSAVNDEPVISNIPNLTLLLGQSAPDLAFTVGDVETPVTNLVLSVASSNPALVPTNNVTLGGSGSNRTVRATPVGGVTGTATITVTVSDGAASASDPFVLQVQAAADPSETNLVSHWRFDETNGAIAFDSVGPNPGTLVNGPLRVAGLIGRAIEFDGVNDYVNVSDSPSLDLPPNFTFSLWFKPSRLLNNTTGRKDLFQKFLSYWLILNFPANDGRLAFTRNQGSPVTHSLTNTWESNVWHFVACTYDGQSMKIYVNGVLQSSLAAVGVVDNSTYALQIGGNTQQGYYFPGAIDDVRIHRVALSSNDVAFLHDLGLAGGPPPPANNPPTLGAIGAQSTSEDTPAGPLPFIVGDFETSAGSLTLAGTSSNPMLLPNAGIVFGGSGSNRTVTLTPAANQSGSSVVEIVLTDGDGGRTTNSFTLTVTPVNDPPSISDIGNQTLVEDQASADLPLTVGDLETPANGLTLSATSTNTTLVPNGNVTFGGSGSNRTVRVTPAPDATGVTLITVTVTDADGGVMSDTFVVNVTPVNDPPAISDLANLTIDEDTSTGALPFMVSDPDTAGAGLTVTAVSSNQALVPNGSLVLGGAGTNRSITATPLAHQSGATLITVFVSDGQATNSDSFLLTVTPVNDAPSISDIANQTTDQDVATGNLPFAVGDVESAAASLTLSAFSTNTTLVPHGNVTFGGSGSNRTVRVTPAAGAHGVTRITVTVTDPDGGTNTDAFVVTVLAGNTPPVISDIADQVIDEDGSAGPIPFSVGDGETAAAGLTVTAVSSNQALVPNGSLVLGGAGTNRTISAAPLAHQSGVTLITVRVSDGQATNSDSFLLTVTPVNDAPSISAIADLLTTQNDPTGDAPFAVGDLESAAGSLTLSAFSTNSALVPHGNVTFGGSGSNRTVRVTPAAGVNGMTRVTVTVTDPDGGTNVSAFLVTVLAMNTPPAITDIADQVIDEDSATGAIPFSVSDAETAAAALTVTVASSNPALVPDANLVLGGAGTNRTLSATPLPNQSGSAILTVFVWDGLATNSEAFTLTVTPVNDLPSISDIPGQTVNQDEATAHVPFTVGDLETSAGGLTLSAFSTNTVLVPHANVTFGGSGSNRTVRVTPAAGTNGTALVIVTVTDADGGTNSDAFLVTVIAPNAPPAITGLADRAIDEDSATGAMPFMVADNETPAGSLTVTVVSSNPALVPNANLVLGGAGTNRTLAATPLANQSGSTVITVSVSDGEATNSAAFTLTVNPINDLPVIANIPDQTVPQDQATADLPFAIGDVETAAGSLTLTGDSSNPVLVPVANIVFGGSGSNRTVRVTPATGQTGLVTITVTANDGAATASDTFLLTVQGVTEPSPTNLIAHWKFNEASGNTALDSAGPSHGTLVNGPVRLPGSTGGAVCFDGVNDYVNVPDSATLDLPPNFTFSLWFRPSQVLNGAIGRKDLFKKFLAYWLILNYPNNDGRLSFVLNGGALVVRSTTSLWGTSQWHHVACTYNGTQMRIYVNGVLEGSGAASVAVANTIYPLQIGGNTEQGFWFPGCIDDVRLYKTALASNEVGQLFALGSVTGAPPAPNTPPSISDIPAQTVAEDTATGPIPFTVADAETAAASLAVSGTSSNPALVPDGNIVFGGSGGSRTVTVTPAAHASGAATITISVADGNGGTNTDSFLLTVNAVNDAPTISAISNQSIQQDSATPLLPFTVGDVETPAIALLVAAASSNPALVPVGNVALGGSGSNRTVLVTPVTGLTGSSFITLTVSDDSGGVASNTFLVMVLGVNTPPSISDVANLTVDEDTVVGPLAFVVGDTQSPASVLEVTAVSSNQTLLPNAGITLGGANSNRTVTLRPATNQSGSVTLTLTVSDGQASAVDTFTLTVNPVNDPPFLSDVTDRTVNKNQSTGDLPFMVGDVDHAAAGLTLSATSSNPALVPTNHVTFGGSGSNRTVRVLPATNQTGTVTVTITVRDGALSASDSFVLTVRDVTPGAISHWRLDEASGASALDSLGANHGTLVNGPLRVPGLMGGALSFDGVNDYVNIPDAASLDLSNRFSVSLWFRPSATLGAATGRKDLLKKFLSYWLILNYPSNDGRISFILNSGSPFVRTVTSSWPSNQWHHIACTYDGTALLLYVNGALEATTPTSVFPANTANPLQFGGNSEQSIYFPGAMDDVRLFGVPLNAMEVADLHAQGVGGMAPSGGFVEAGSHASQSEGSARLTIHRLPGGAGLALRWNAIPGRTYRVEYKDDLSEPAWKKIAPDVRPDGSIGAYDDRSIDGRQRFYRVVLLP